MSERIETLACGGCGKKYRIKNPSPARTYSCPQCKKPLARAAAAAPAPASRSRTWIIASVAGAVPLAAAVAFVVWGRGGEPPAPEPPAAAPVAAATTPQPAAVTPPEPAVPAPTPPVETPVAPPPQPAPPAESLLLSKVHGTVDGLLALRKEGKYADALLELNRFTASMSEWMQGAAPGDVAKANATLEKVREAIEEAMKAQWETFEQWLRAPDYRELVAKVKALDRAFHDRASQAVTAALGAAILAEDARVLEASAAGDFGAAADLARGVLAKAYTPALRTFLAQRYEELGKADRVDADRFFGPLEGLLGVPGRAGLQAARKRVEAALADPKLACQRALLGSIAEALGRPAPPAPEQISKWREEWSRALEAGPRGELPMPACASCAGQGSRSCVNCKGGAAVGCVPCGRKGVLVCSECGGAGARVDLGGMPGAAKADEQAKALVAELQARDAQRPRPSGGGAAWESDEFLVGRINDFRVRFAPGCPPEVAAARRDGLLWLARHQSADGSWPWRTSVKACAGHGGADCPVGLHPMVRGSGQERTIGITALAAMAFMAAGHTESPGDEFGGVVGRALDYLTKLQTANGCVGMVDPSNYMYDHILSTAALAEGVGLTGSARRRATAQRGVDFLVQAQGPGGGWRYVAGANPADVSVTGWAVVTLLTAETAGLKFDRATVFGAARSYLERMLFEEGTKTGRWRAGYQTPGPQTLVIDGVNNAYDQHQTMTAIWSACRPAMDPKRAEARLRLWHTALSDDPPQIEALKLDYYYWYWGALALAQQKGEFLPAWSKRLVETVLQLQVRAAGSGAFGSWEPKDRWGGVGGRVYATAINVLTLSAPWRYPRFAERR